MWVKIEMSPGRSATRMTEQVDTKWFHRRCGNISSDDECSNDNWSIGSDPKLLGFYSFSVSLALTFTEFRTWIEPITKLHPKRADRKKRISRLKNLQPLKQLSNLQLNLSCKVEFLYSFSNLEKQKVQGWSEIVTNLVFSITFPMSHSWTRRRSFLSLDDDCFFSVPENIGTVSVETTKRRILFLTSLRKISVFLATTIVASLDTFFYSGFLIQILPERKKESFSDQIVSASMKNVFERRSSKLEIWSRFPNQS